MSPRDAALALCAAALLAGLAGCEDPPPAPPPGPTPLPRPAAPPAPRAPAVRLPSPVAQALQGIEWEPLDYLEHLPEIVYKVHPDCTLEYVDTGVLSLSDSTVGAVKHSYFQRFDLLPQGPERMVRRPGRRLEYLRLEFAGRRVGGFLDTSRHLPPPTTLEVEPRQVRFASTLSPLFQLRSAEATDLPSPLHVWPTLATADEPASWPYHLLFHTAEALESQPPARVEFVGWIRLGFQRAAYLTATWPEAADSLPIRPRLAHVRIQRRRPVSSTLRQRGDLQGHYLVSENGYLLLAHLEGTARIRNVFSVQPRPGAARQDYEVDEDRNFSFTTKLLSDCHGSLFSKIESEELGEAETVELAERFANLMAVGRAGEAAELLSPAIRYAFPDGAPLLLIKETLAKVGGGLLGRPAAAEGGAPAPGVPLVGRDKRTKKPLYSLVRGARIGGRPYLTFLGSSTRADRGAWDVLIVEPGSIHSGAVRLLRR